MDGSTDIPICDNEPIHIPGSIQPHGLMLVASRAGLLTWQAAGEPEAWLRAPDWHGAPLATLIGPDLAERAARFAAEPSSVQAAPVAYLGQLHAEDGRPLDVSAHLAGLAGAPADQRDMLIIELEPAAADSPSAAVLLHRLDEAAAAFTQAPSMEDLCTIAATAFRALTGFDRVMIYHFLDDAAGSVLAESRRDDIRSFLHHHFPGSDIPRQARALYVRNLVRVIPDIHYTPAALRPPAPGAPLDLSDASLRSVSPIHLQYLFNMGVRASASVSIVKDGALWGLVACHHETPRRIPYEIRVACRTLAAALARQIHAKEDAEFYRQQLRLRSFEDDLVRLLSREQSLEHALGNHVDEVRRALHADGVAVVRGTDVFCGGTCPDPDDLHALAHWIATTAGAPIRATDRLSHLHEPAARYADIGSGLLAMTLSPEEPWMVLWFRAEQIQIVNWAGNPHAAHDRTLDDQLTPRASFEDWSETVRGQARPWTPPELQAVTRLRDALLDARQNRRMQELNHRLTDLLRDKDMLLQQKQFLIGEVSHRVQNSLQLVSSFLSMQSGMSDDPRLRTALEEACRRLNAVGLVHRRLYRGDQIETIDAARYIEELCADMLAAMGPEWRQQLSLDLAPIAITTDRAVTIGLILTELVINIQKYAYDGRPGPIDIRLRADRALHLTIADRGIGRPSSQGDAPPRQGFGTRLIAALVRQLHGTLEFADNAPGLRATLIA